MVTMRYESPLGPLLLGESEGKLRFLLFPGWQYEAAPGESAVLKAARNWLDMYFAGSDPGEPPPCEPEGTAFQRRVWEALRHVPYGETCTYGELAARLHTAARPVGGALNKNPLPIFLPCHRVIGSDGRLTGFAGGLSIKEKLLRLEQIQEE